VDVLKPAKLRRNSKIAVISPSSNPNLVGLQMGLDVLKKMGLRVVLGDTTRKLLTVGTRAAEDSLRAKDFDWAFRDDSVDGVICATGGYGSIRILDLLDYDMIRDHPKVFLGFSDITGYHVALNQMCNMITYHGRDVEIVWNEASKKVENIKIAKHELELEIRQLMGEKELKEIKNPPGGMMLMTINDGKASGRLCGGNLSLVTDTLGSRYEIDTRGKILMLEEYTESYYHIEAYLTRLRLTRKLERANGIIVGEFSETLKSPSPTPSIEEIVRERVGGARKPSVWGLCCGHGEHNMLMPLNARVSLDASNRRIRVLEGIVE